MSTDATPDTPIERALKEKEKIQSDLRVALDHVARIGKFLDSFEQLPPHLAEPLKAQVEPAIRERAKYQAQLQPFMNRLRELEQFLAMYRSLSVPTEAETTGVSSTNDSAYLSRAGMGLTQPVFEEFVRTVLRDLKRPLQSGEMVEEFRRRGHPIGGSNEVKTAWNRLWEAKRTGTLINLPGIGYWLPDVPLPEGAEEAARAAQAERRAQGRHKLGRPVRGRGTPRGRPPILSEAQIRQAEHWMITGEKTVVEICKELGGISVGTLYNATGGRDAVRERYPELVAQYDSMPKPKRPKVHRIRRVRSASDGKLGRPPTLAGELAKKAEEMYLNGAPMKLIADAFDVNLTTVYRYFGMENKERWEKRRDEYQAQQRNKRR